MTLDRIPPDALIDDVAILGKKGAGKTHTARGEVERLLDDGRRSCIIDPTGVWFGLRLEPDGKTASPYQVVVFGGDHGDVPLEGASGEKLADLIAGGDFSAIIDTKRLTVGERTRLFTGFAERLAQVNRRPIYLVIDEAHLFAPQGRVNDPQSGRMVHAANNLVSGGRALGIRIMLITQRPAKLHKDSLSQVETLVAMRLVAPQDRAAVEEWIKEQADAVRGREIIASLPQLPTGEGWIWSPQHDVLDRAKFRPIRTFDSSRTPVDGAPEAQPPRLASLDLALLQAALLPEDDAPSRPAPGRRTPSVPRPDATSDAMSNARAIEKAFELGRAEGFELGYRTGHRAGWSGGLRAAQDAFGKLLAAPAAEVSAKSIATNYSLLTTVRAASAQPGEPAAAQDQAKSDLIASFGAPERASGRTSGSQLVPRMLEALRRSPRRQITLDDVSILAVASPISGPSRIARNELRAIVEVAPDGRVAHREWNGEREPLARDDIVDAWRAKLSGMAAEILGVLFVLGHASKDGAAGELGRSPISGPWRVAWKRLRTNLLVEPYGENDHFQLARILRELPRAVELAA